MHTNYYFLRQLAPALESSLTGLKLLECYSQDRDELVLVFAQAKGKTNYYRPFFIKTTLRPDFSGLLFPESVQRARTNSIDLFEELYGKAVIGVRSFLNERCLGIILEDNFTLLFKFFGNRPNLLAFEGDGVTDVFNQKLVTDHQLTLSALDRPIDQSYAAFERVGYDHRKLFPTFGKIVNEVLKERAIEQKDGKERWELIQGILGYLEQPRYYLTRFNHQLVLSLLPVGDIVREFTDPVEAANRFYVSYAGQNFFEREKSEVLRLLDKRLKRAKAQIDANMQRLIGREESVKNEEIANILMANLHEIEEPPGQRSPELVTLYDFYRDKPVTIKLKTELTPQKNAESFYRKAKNEKIEEDHLQQQIVTREQEIAQIETHLQVLATITSLKELRRYIKQNQLLVDSASDGPVQVFKEVQHEGFTILIGRNARNNDLLTQRYAYKEDLWLHARDVSGSHVVVKYKAGKPFPKSVIERAAELAAWNSKRRTDSLCPVIVTPKKFVRKPKGLAEGQVVIEKEEVVMVVPKS